MINSMKKMIKVYGVYLFIAFLVYISIDLFMYVKVAKMQNQVVELTEKMKGLDGATLRCEEYEKQEDVPVCGFYDAEASLLRVKMVSMDIYNQGCKNPIDIGGILVFQMIVKPEDVGDIAGSYSIDQGNTPKCLSDSTNCIVHITKLNAFYVILSLPEPKCLRWGLTRG